jgi:hypothetical protein
VALALTIGDSGAKSRLQPLKHFPTWPELKEAEVAQFELLREGSCINRAMFPILDQAVCQAAARHLGLLRTEVSATSAMNRPEGCYYYEAKSAGGPPESREGLWISYSVLTQGKGSETSDVAKGEFREPICASKADCGIIDENVRYPGVVYLTMSNIPNAAVCCQKCQADMKCGAWAWDKTRSANGYALGACHLQEPQTNLSAPPRVKNLNFVSGLPIRRHAIGSMYCLALMQSSGYEKVLLQTAHQEGTSIFSCDEHAIYSNKVLEVAPGLFSGAIESDLRCRNGGDAGTALNTGIFIALWKKVIGDGRFRFHDWTVKVDPDAVFFPERLRPLLLPRVEGENGTYINNCKYGLHGPIEIFSRKALVTYGSRFLECEQKLWFAYDHWGEDMYMDQCLQKVLKVTRENDYGVLCEDHCDCPEYTLCQTGAISFHPFKTVPEYRQCMINAGVTLKV